MATYKRLLASLWQLLGRLHSVTAGSMAGCASKDQRERRPPQRCCLLSRSAAPALPLSGWALRPLLPPWVSSCVGARVMCKLVRADPRLEATALRSVSFIICGCAVLGRNGRQRAGQAGTGHGADPAPELTSELLQAPQPVSDNQLCQRNTPPPSRAGWEFHMFPRSPGLPSSSPRLQLQNTSQTLTLLNPCLGQR